jgi:hypothetical protein
MSPTARSLEYLRADGWEPWVVERWTLKGTGRKLFGRSLFILENRLDLWNFADIIAMRPGSRPLLVQTTASGCVSARQKKIVESPYSGTALDSGFDIHIHGWRKVLKVPGGKLKVWRPRIIVVTKELLNDDLVHLVHGEGDSGIQ